MEHLKSKSKGELRSKGAAKNLEPLSPNEVMAAEREIVKCVQRSLLKNELECLKRLQRNPSQKTGISKGSSIYKLDPMLKDDLLRVGGRLQRASLEYEAKHPVILPKKNHVSNLIIHHYHQLSGHSGLEYTLSLTRRKYWIIAGRASVRKIVNECFSYRRRQAPVMQQKMSDLPEDRVAQSMYVNLASKMAAKLSFQSNIEFTDKN